MRTYRRGTYEDRCQTYALRKAGQTEIARLWGLAKGRSAGNQLEMPASSGSGTDHVN